MERIVRLETLRRQVEHLDDAADPKTRKAFHRLLADAEKRLGDRRERLKQTLAFISELEARILRKRAVLDGFDEGAGSVELARECVRGMSRTLELLVSYGEHLVGSIERDRLS
jgi:hypothetical protein